MVPLEIAASSRSASWLLDQRSDLRSCALLARVAHADFVDDSAPASNSISEVYPRYLQPSETPGAAQPPTTSVLCFSIVSFEYKVFQANVPTCRIST